MRRHRGFDDTFAAIFLGALAIGFLIWLTYNVQMDKLAISVGAALIVAIIFVVVFRGRR